MSIIYTSLSLDSLDNISELVEKVNKNNHIIFIETVMTRNKTEKSFKL